MNVLRLADPAGVVERTPKFKNKRPKKVFFSKGQRPKLFMEPGWARQAKRGCKLSIRP